MSFTAHWQCRHAEVQKLLSSIPQRLAEISQKKGGQLISSLCIDILYCTLHKIFFSFNGFLMSILSPKGSRFLSPGVYKNKG
jgi:hypothetical protein